MPADDGQGPAGHRHPAAFAEAAQEVRAPGLHPDGLRQLRDADLLILQAGQHFPVLRVPLPGGA